MRVASNRCASHLHPASGWDVLILPGVGLVVVLVGRQALWPVLLSGAPDAIRFAELAYSLHLFCTLFSRRDDRDWIFPPKACRHGISSPAAVLTYTPSSCLGVINLQSPIPPGKRDPSRPYTTTPIESHSPHMPIPPLPRDRRIPRFPPRLPSAVLAFRLDSPASGPLGSPQLVLGSCGCAVWRGHPGLAGCRCCEGPGDWGIHCGMPVAGQAPVATEASHPAVYPCPRAHPSHRFLPE